MGVWHKSMPHGSQRVGFHACAAGCDSNVLRSGRKQPRERPDRTSKGPFRLPMFFLCVCVVVFRVSFAKASQLRESLRGVSGGPANRRPASAASRISLEGWHKSTPHESQRVGFQADAAACDSNALRCPAQAAPGASGENVARSPFAFQCSLCVCLCCCVSRFFREGIAAQRIVARCSPWAGETSTCQCRE